jgi:hypothetical protein
MLPALLPVIGGLVSGGTKAITGAVQAAQAKKALRELGPDPGARVATSVEEATARARQLAGTAFIDPRDIEFSRGRTSDVLSEATRRGSGLDNVAEAYRMEQRDQARRFSQAANEFYGNNQAYMAALRAQGAEEVRVQRYNQDRYRQAEQGIQAARTAAQENIGEGFDMIGAGFVAAGMGGGSKMAGDSGADAGTMPTKSTQSGGAVGTLPDFLVPGRSAQSIFASQTNRVLNRLTRDLPYNWDPSSYSVAPSQSPPPSLRPMGMGMIGTMAGMMGGAMFDRLTPEQRAILGVD